MHNTTNFPLHEQLRSSNGFFMEYFHRPHLDPEDEIPDFHIDMADLMLTSAIPRFACAVPREHSKTTTAKLMVVKALLFHNYNFPMYISDTHEVASSALKDIWAYLTSEQYFDLAGEMPQDKTEGQKKASIQLSRGIYEFRVRWFPEGCSANERVYKTVNMIAKGAGAQIRGTNKAHQRPDLAIFDDVETEEIVNSEVQYEKYKKWFYGPVMKALKRKNHRIIQIGNLIGQRSLIIEHMKAPTWTSRRYGAIKPDGTPLWPALWPPAELKKDYDDYARLGMLPTWYAEMMNLPFDPDSSLIDLETVLYLDQPDPADPTILAAFINIDPAISKSARADNCAIVVTVMRDTGVFQHVEVHAAQGMDYIDIFNKAAELADKWYSNLIFIEDEAFQGVLLPVFRNMADMEQKNYTFIGVPTAKVAKLARLRAWASWLSKQEAALTYGESSISSELATFNRRKKDNDDDIIDACAQLPTVLDIAYSEIMHSRVSGHSTTTGGPVTIEGTMV